jgi:hypothetical protein
VCQRFNKKSRVVKIREVRVEGVEDKRLNINRMARMEGMATILKQRHLLWSKDRTDSSK